MKVRVLFWIVGIVAFIPALLLTLAGYFNGPPFETRIPVLLASFAPYGLVAAVLALFCFVMLAVGFPKNRAIVMTLITIVVLGFAVVRQSGLVLGGDEAKAGYTFSVMTTNLRVGTAAPAEVLETAAMNQADVIVLQEVTPEALAAIRQLDTGRDYRFQAGEPAPGVSGTMVLSKLPLTDVKPIALSNGGWSMKVGDHSQWRLIAVHTSPPADDLDAWRRDLDLLSKAAAQQQRIPGASLVVAGDFNATLDHAALRRVLDRGLRDSVDACAAGWQPTWPQPGNYRVPSKFPLPIIAIDHVLMSNQISCVQTRTVPMGVTDHRAVVSLLLQLPT